VLNAGCTNGRRSYLKQAFGPLWGFLFGWTSLLAIQAGPVAYLGVAFGDYLGAFVPFFSSKHTLRERPVQSLLGVGMVALGVPFFRWRRRSLGVGARER
jgi:basic amino acid/polyamine antiporter, APA family